MHAYDAYRTQRDAATPRIDLIITAFRKVLEWLNEAEAKRSAGDSAGATSLLSRSQTVIAALAGGVAAAPDETSVTFLRLYEFASHCLAQGDEAKIDSARKVLRTLLDGFEAAREQAVTLEARGAIAPLGTDHMLELTV